jgi:hypothetical protein
LFTRLFMWLFAPLVAQQPNNDSSFIQNHASEWTALGQNRSYITDLRALFTSLPRAYLPV